MANVFTGELPPGTKRCKACREPINFEAAKCIHCQSDQRWISRLSVSATMMSLLVALVSVLTAAVPAIKSLLTKENSELIFSPQGFTADTVSVLVSNKGIRPGSLRSGSVVLNDGVLMILHIRDLPKNEPKIVDAGETTLVNMYSESHLESVATPNQCNLRLINMDFKGKRREDVVAVDCAEAMPFLSAHGPNVR